MPKFSFLGTPTLVSSSDSAILRSIHPNIQVEQYSVSTSRSGVTEPITIDTSNDDLIVMQMSNEVEWLYRADDFEQFLMEQPVAKNRGVGGALMVPPIFQLKGDTRGFVETVTTMGLKKITGMVAKSAAKLLAERMEQNLDTGLHSLNDRLDFIAFDKNKISTDKPYLLFIHGTNSSTEGAFKELRTNDAYNKLFKHYEGRVLAFEHKTLSESPLKNLADLLSALPDNITLEIISHSRGGIIADLLARCSDGGLPFDKDEKNTIATNEKYNVLEVEADIANQAALGKQIIVKKIVRVACPAAGTNLIDSRLDNLVNVLCNLLKLIPGANACMPLELFLEFAKAVVHERTSIDVFPGLAAQIPNSPLILLLNNPNRPIESELFVISGDAEYSGILNSMLVLALNLYFGEAHDYVVNSNSMFKGTYRKTIVKEFFEQESTVNHFNYFKNKKSQDALLAALADVSRVEEFYEDLGISKDIVKKHSRGISGKKPVVFILPGILGSHLEDVDKKERLWVNFLGITTGSLAKLRVEAENIQAAELHAQTYGELINYLSPDFDIYPFPYDWRMDITETAKKLADSIENELKNPDRTMQEFHFIVHSMGGLVLRAMIHHHTALWAKITSSKKTKVLMLGVPNEGSYATIRILLGKDSLIKKLALLDFKNSKKELLEVFKNFPGLVQLLPKNLNGIFDETLWNNLKDSNNEFTAVPNQDILKKGLDFYHSIENTNYDNDIFRYIAGQDDSTPENFSTIDRKIIFTSTSQGDGRVLWSTIPSSLRSENIYYVAADHGSIPKFERAFAGFKELLQKGKTDVPALSKSKPFTRSGNEVQIMPDSDFVTIPTESELNEGLLSSKEKFQRRDREEIINITVINGDLIHSKYPVVVGHFEGDGIVYAEKYLDRALGFKLSEYHLVNNYPGDIGTHLVILNDNIGVSENMICSGGVIVGLGDFGSLTEGRLLVSLTQALLTLAIKQNELIKNKAGKGSKQDDFGISPLLVGSDFAGLRITTSVKVILLAVMQVNEKLEAMSKLETIPQKYKKIDHIEIVEIYQHKAIQIGRVIKNFLELDNFSHFRFVPPAVMKGSGSLKIIPDENLQDNWHRLEVSITKKDNAVLTEADRRLLPIRFTAITDKAHAHEELLPANRLIVESLIEKVAKNSSWNIGFSQTLYELLIPNEFKGYGSGLRNLVLIVDEQTARYPWELLQDANGVSDKPMVINTGILRQLKTNKQRENIILNNSNRALVIGNPFTEGQYPSLPAAEKEAIRVSNMLQEKGLQTTPSIGENDIDIVQKLLTKSYKIIHIASHGIVGKTADDPTGVVIGKEIIFTAADFDRIRIVPEFVFINCCSSNEYKEEVADQMRRKYDLAASVGTQLIEMGVKAAIVTGWEIDDAAAAAFSEKFYRDMFEGKSFGEAVRDAREKIYAEYGHTNTWGAYQCYGDPFYKFKSISILSKKWNFSFVDAIEVINELDNIVSEHTSSSKRKTAEELESRIDAIIKAMHSDWNEDGRIVEGLANLYKTIDCTEKALNLYKQLFSLENATYSVKSLEQYYSVCTKHAVQQLKLEKIDLAIAKSEIETAIKGLEKMEGKTYERSSLIAASYRRLFDMDNRDLDPLSKAAEYYWEAYQHAEKVSNIIDFYPFFNWLHCAFILSKYEVKEEKSYLKIPENWIELSNVALEYAEAQDIIKPDFYKKTAHSSFYLACILSSEDKNAMKDYSANIVKNFEKTWKKEGTTNEKKSYIDYVKFVISALKTTKDKKRVDILQDVINRIS